MAIYVEDWSGSTVGNEPTGWTKRWVTTGLTYEVVSNASAPSGKALRMTVGGSTIRAAISLDAVGADANRANVEILALVTAPSLTSNMTVFGAVARANDSADSESGYVGRLGGNGLTPQHRNVKYVNGTFTGLSGSAASWATNTLYWVRFRVNGTSLSTSVSPDSNRTATINVSATDSSLSAAGHVGLFMSTSGGQSEVLWVSVATNGDTAPFPDEISTPVAFTGTVPTLNGTEDAAFSEDLSGYFSGTKTPFAYSVQSGTLPAGLSLNTSTGVISGTPTTAGTSSGIVIRATDDGTDTADTNAFDIVIAAADSTAPVLSSPTGTATGETTASGTVTTDEANGTLYAVVTESATPPSAADIRAGTGAAYATSQAVSATGVQNVSATGLTADTTYYWHYLHDDAADNASNIATSASFTTDALPVIGWTTNPAVASVTTNSITISATPNMACDVYAVALRTTQTAPASADVVAGQDGDQLAAASANSAVFTSTPVSITLTGLTLDPTYDVYVVAHIAE